MSKRAGAPTGRRKLSGPEGRKINACDHWLRRRVLRLLLRSGPLSPSEISRIFEQPLGKVVYHMKLLEELGTIELVHERQVRGTIEHLFGSKVKKDKLVRAMLDATQAEDDAL